MSCAEIQIENARCTFYFHTSLVQHLAHSAPSPEPASSRTRASRRRVLPTRAGDDAAAASTKNFPPQENGFFRCCAYKHRRHLGFVCRSSVSCSRSRASARRGGERLVHQQHIGSSTSVRAIATRCVVHPKICAVFAAQRGETKSLKPKFDACVIASDRRSEAISNWGLGDCFARSQ